MTERRNRGGRQSDAQPGCPARREALAWLAARARTTAEVREYLSRRGHDGAVVESTVSWLVESGYLDDAEYAAGWLEDRLRRRPAGRRLLRQALLSRGIDPGLAGEQVDAALAGNDERRLALEAVERKYGRPPAGSPEERVSWQRRAAAFLTRRGFDWETILSVLDALTSGE